MVASDGTNLIKAERKESLIPQADDVNPQCAYFIFGHSAITVISRQPISRGDEAYPKKFLHKYNDGFSELCLPFL